MNNESNNSSNNTLAILIAIIAGFVLIALLFGRGGHGGFHHRFGCIEEVPVYRCEVVRFEPSFHCFPHRVEIFRHR